MIAARLAFYTAFGFVLFLFTKLRKPVFSFYYNRIKWQTPIDRHTYQELDHLLSKHNPYFEKLSLDGKAKFINRVVAIMKRKNFRGMEGLKVTEGMQALIAGSIVQLTFGLKNFWIKEFDNILVYPKSFYHKGWKMHMKGGTSIAGTILLSWKDFMEGYADPEDKYNLGLHEIAHALKLSVLRGEDFDRRFSYYLDEWLQLGAVEFEKMNAKGKSFLRQYGGTNMHEFFAVCVEHFFEAPAAFKKHLPNIYNHLCFLLQQDPENDEGDYALEKRFIDNVNRNETLVPIPRIVRKNHNYDEWHWAMGFMLAGIFVGLPLLIYFMGITVVTAGQVLSSAAIFIGLSLVTQMNYLLKHKVLDRKGYALYLLIGILPLSMGLFFFANAKLAEEAIIYTPKIVGHYYDESEQEYVLQLEGGQWDHHEKFRRVHHRDFEYPGQHPEKLAMRFEKGAFGYLVFRENYVLTDLVTAPPFD